MNALRLFTDPIAFDLLSMGRCSPIKVLIMGVTIAEAIPTKEYVIAMTSIFGATVQHIADIMYAKSPYWSSVLCFSLMLRMLTRRAIIVLSVAETVCICPATPIETPNVMLISIKNRLIIVPGGSSGAAEMINDSRVVF